MSSAGSTSSFGAHCVLMTGLPGSGKTTLARALESAGMLRICPDERVWKEHGHYGTDFPRGEYKVREAPVLEQVARDLSRQIAAGHDVVLDHGLWTAQERHEWRSLVEQAGGVAVLVYLPADLDVLWERIEKRNEQTLDDPNAMFFSYSDLRRHAGRFVPPGADEPHVRFTGVVDAVLRALRTGEAGPT
ncbi:AAA family ATPase (plasmid) [Streptomyces sp. SDT5-1]|uniref:AAA family ATPase n=1 Tax=Streptomyces sp. SDT5-1 TaxID=3406418 RepID=UPI003FD56A9A